MDFRFHVFRQRPTHVANLELASQANVQSSLSWSFSANAHLFLKHSCVRQSVTRGCIGPKQRGVACNFTQLHATAISPTQTFSNRKKKCYRRRIHTPFFTACLTRCRGHLQDTDWERATCRAHTAPLWNFWLTVGVHLAGAQKRQALKLSSFLCMWSWNVMQWCSPSGCMHFDAGLGARHFHIIPLHPPCHAPTSTFWNFSNFAMQ